ncbi:hypothetical protein, partial [Klebsiella pneumoniae]|uniref:hypothetical protein n=2 Tax=Klebsiella pneumoniae TaxID=573 RepID=UPI001C70715B
MVIAASETPVIHGIAELSINKLLRLMLTVIQKKVFVKKNMQEEVVSFYFSLGVSTCKSLKTILVNWRPRECRFYPECFREAQC